MDDEVRRLERAAAQDPSVQPALLRARDRAGIPSTVAALEAEVASLAARLDEARAGQAEALARCWRPLVEALFREEPGLDLLVVTTSVEQRHDRPWTIAVHVAVDGPTIVEVIGVEAALGVEAGRSHPTDAGWRFNLLDDVARAWIRDAVLEAAPHLAGPGWTDRRLVLRRGPDGAVVEAEEEGDVPLPEQARAALDEQDELRELRLADAGVREVRQDERGRAAPTPQPEPVPAASSRELVARLRATSARASALRADALAALGEAFDRLLVALSLERPDVAALAIQGFTPTYCDGDPCLHLQHVNVSATALASVAAEARLRGQDDLGLARLAALGSRDPPAAAELKERLAPFAPALEARHGSCWLLVVERLGPGRVDVRLGPGWRDW